MRRDVESFQHNVASPQREGSTLESVKRPPNKTAHFHSGYFANPKRRENQAGRVPEWPESSADTQKQTLGTPPNQQMSIITLTEMTIFREIEIISIRSTGDANQPSSSGVAPK